MEENPKSPPKQDQDPAPAASRSGWGGWGISPLSVFSDLQKAAAVAAEEISRNAVVVAQNAAKGIAEMQNAGPDQEPGKEDGEVERSSVADDAEAETDEDKLRKSALDRLEKVSEDSMLGQGLKALDNSVENLASGAWKALGSAWRGGSNLVHKLENSAASLADSIQHGDLPAKAGSLAPSLIETGKAFTAKGMQVLELVGKETMDLLILETGIEVEKNPKEAVQEADEEQFLEEITFDRCFYIYGGPEQLEELEALSSHYGLLFNRRKAKLSSEQKSLYDGKLKQVQQIFCLSSEIEGSADPDKGKNIETVEEGSGNEIEIMRDSSVSKAADMAAGFTAALGGLAASEIIQRTVDRLETIHSEGVHRLSELCCFAVSQLLMLGKSVISNANKSQNEDAVKIDWPEDPASKAKIIRAKAQSMTGDVEAVSNSFITGISDVVEAYLAAIKGASADANGLPEQASIQEKANAISNHLRSDRSTGIEKIQDGLQYLAFVVVSTSMPTA